MVFLPGLALKNLMGPMGFEPAESRKGILCEAEGGQPGKGGMAGLEPWEGGVARNKQWKKGYSVRLEQ